MGGPGRLFKFTKKLLLSVSHVSVRLSHSLDASNPACARIRCTVRYLPFPPLWFLHF